MWFFYDSTGTRIGVQQGNVTAYYMYNLQGDVIGLTDAATGKVIAKYLYDAWGKIVSVKNASGYTIGTSNPFRYRGYYYDTETGFYYLNSRYYNPEVGRFLNADAFASTDISGVLSTNMFAYCENNPVMRSDPTGEAFLSVLAGALGGAAASAAVYMAATGNIDAKGCLTAMASGALIGALSGVEHKFRAVASVVAGIYSGVKTGINTKGSTGEKIAAGVINGTITAVTNYSGTGVKSNCGTTVGGKVLDVYANAHVNFGFGFKVGMISEVSQKAATKVVRGISSAFKSVRNTFVSFFDRW